MNAARAALAVLAVLFAVVCVYVAAHEIMLGGPVFSSLEATIAGTALGLATISLAAAGKLLGRASRSRSPTSTADRQPVADGGEQ
ncbi:hypothetical protein [Halolamina salifodinae]|uniref:Uncharacterized protein n=1 Tax=Halolamina salifodinae TaxID=1202767 RepID=A0A8T4GSU7_9EURY|nr:hypothetical protein [Halolamina salifodinae]MBP1985949.1 hypothetical protein [Halolamina salifodinae]